jgi:methyl coenzyme M reductase alpha subunit
MHNIGCVNNLIKVTFVDKNMMFTLNDNYKFTSFRACITLV